MTCVDDVSVLDSIWGSFSSESVGICGGVNGDCGAGGGVGVLALSDDDSGFSKSKPNETSVKSTSLDLFRKTTGGGFDCRLTNDGNDEEDEWDDKRGDDCSVTGLDMDGTCDWVCDGDCADGWDTVGEEGSGGEDEEEFVVLLSSLFPVVDINGFIFERLLRIVGRTTPFCVDDWKRRLSLVFEDNGKRDDRVDNNELLSWRRSLITRRRCVTVTNGSEIFSLFELLKFVGDDNDSFSLSSFIGEVLGLGSNQSDGRDVSPF